MIFLSDTVNSLCEGFYSQDVRWFIIRDIDLWLLFSYNRYFVLTSSQITAFQRVQSRRVTLIVIISEMHLGNWF